MMCQMLKHFPVTVAATTSATVFDFVVTFETNWFLLL